MDNVLTTLHARPQPLEVQEGTNERTNVTLTSPEAMTGHHQAVTPVPVELFKHVTLGIGQKHLRPLAQTAVA